jgi:hypothetical protein
LTLVEFETRLRVHHRLHWELVQTVRAQPQWVHLRQTKVLQSKFFLSE